MGEGLCESALHSADFKARSCLPSTRVIAPLPAPDLVSTLDSGLSWGKGEALNYVGIVPFDLD